MNRVSKFIPKTGIAKPVRIGRNEYRSTTAAAMALGCMTGTIMRHRGERTPNQLEQKPAKRAHGLVAGSIWYHSPAKVADARGIKAGPVRQALQRGLHFKKLGQAREHLAKPIKVGGKTYAGSSEAA